jgi:hypothetical protein
MDVEIRLVRLSGVMFGGFSTRKLSAKIWFKTRSSTLQGFQVISFALPDAHKSWQEFGQRVFDELHYRFGRVPFDDAVEYSVENEQVGAGLGERVQEGVEQLVQFARCIDRLLVSGGSLYVLSSQVLFISDRASGTRFHVDFDSVEVSIGRWWPQCEQ